MKRYTRFRKLVENRCEGSKIRHLYFRHFEDFNLPKLSTKQQQEIADRLDAADFALAGTKNLKARLVGLRQSLANSILN